MKQSMTYIERIVTALTVVMLVVCCADYDAPALINGDMPLTVSGEINQMAVSRVNDNGFANGDCMGVYVVDYDGNVPGTLLTKGNRATNVCHTFDEPQGKWTPAYDIYWKDEHTHADIYAYYPFDNSTPTDINAVPFVLQSNQSTPSAADELGGYEASDFLWGKAENVSPTSSTVRLSLSHVMSCARIKLAEGSGFNAGEWENTDKQVVVSNTRRECTIDMSTGTVNVTGKVETSGTIPAQRGDEWRAIVLPQTINAETTIFAITVDGIPYKFTKSSNFTFQQGKISNFTIVVDKITATGKYTLRLINESISEWENDLFSHDAMSKEYYVVHSTPGNLRAAISNSGKDYRKIRNLKITGTIDSRDFYFMRDSMSMLEALNLKQVRIKGQGYSSVYAIKCLDNQIPSEAFYRNDSGEGKLSLVNLVLPDTLVSIGARAFNACRNLTGSLVIPEGVVDIQQGAFNGCINLNGTLSLPSTLRKLGNCGNGPDQDTKDEGIDYYGGVFQGCTSLTGNLVIPDGVQLIRGFCFADCRGFEGTLHLPDNLKRIGIRAFSFCHGLTGSLTIPTGMTDIPADAFWDCGFDGTLNLHDGITTIGQNAFNNTHFKGELVLPKYLKTIGYSAFENTNFCGSLRLPNTVMQLGDRAFANCNRISGTLEFPNQLVSIGEYAFEGCRSLEGLVLPESVGNIRRYAFNECFGINSIVCYSHIPPTLGEGAMNGVGKGNFTVEVPEASLIQYKTAPRWKDFKRIAAHHELVCRPSAVCALSSQHKQTVVVDAEGEWEVKSKPSWCEVYPSSGNKKTQVTITVNAMNSSTEKRSGEVVFILKSKDYTHTCYVNQCGYQYSEDEFLTLQKATQGKRGGINLVIMGDGYNAEDISSGAYLKDMKNQVERFFDIEPFTTYRNYFNVYTAFPLSTERGIGTVNTIIYNHFNTTYTGSIGMKADYDEIFKYVLSAETITKDNLAETLIIIVPNSTEYGGITQMWDDGRAISFCPLSTDSYPYDSRGVIQHEAGGHGFGKLADECILHNAFIDACSCGCCGHADAINYYKSLGWYDNISLTNKIYSVPWSHYISDPRYNTIVDVFEGGFMHSRGVFRSEQNSCMNNDIPYFNTISRESIVRRIKRYAGEQFSLADFISHDQSNASAAKVSSRATTSAVQKYGKQMKPVIHKSK